MPPPVDPGMSARPHELSGHPLGVPGAAGPLDAAAALRRSEERYRALAEALTDMVWTTDAAGMVEDMPGWRRLTGQSREEVRGTGWANAIHPDDRPRVEGAWWSASARRAVYEAEYRLRMADGSYRRFRARGVPVLEPNGDVREWVGAFDDVEEARRAAEAEREARAAAERLADRAARLHALTAALAAPLDAAEVARVVTERATEALGAAAGVLVLLDSAGARFEVVASVGYPAHVRERWRGFPADAPLPIAESVRAGEPVVTRSAAERARRYPALADEGAPSGPSISVPLLHDGRALGGIGLVFTDPAPVGEAGAPDAGAIDVDAEFLMALGRQCAQALERARLDAEIRSSEARYRSLVEATAIGVWRAGPTGEFLDAQPAWTEYTGQPGEYQLGWARVEMFHPEDRARVRGAWRGAAERGELYAVEARLWHAASREHRWCVARAVPVRGMDGRIAEWVGTFADVDDRKRADAALVVARAEAEAYLAEAERARARVERVFEQAPVAVCVLRGPDMVHELANPHWRAIVGGRRLLGRRLAEAVPELAGPLLGRLREVLATGVPWTVHEYPIALDRAGDGGGALEECWFSVAVHPLDERGEASGLVVVATEVTEQVRARREAERLREAAEEANRAKAEFLSTMSHELRTPLNAIGGYVDLLELGVRGPVTEEQARDLARIRAGARVLLSIVNDILNFARLEAGQVEFHSEEVPLERAMASLDALVAPQVRARRLAFTWVAEPAPDGRPLTVRADPERLRQVLLNLLTNAVKFTDPGGAIAVACDAVTDAAGRERVRVRVRDTGRGIPPPQLERVFEPFVQVDRHLTHESQQGVGLGLAISRDLARRMEGDLYAESVVGVGSTFTLLLPRSAPNP
jgi:PAS domain S-box-containing protein